MLRAHGLLLHQVTLVQVLLLIILTFPSGFTLSSITGGTFAGSPIGAITTTATTISFSAPVDVAKNRPFTIVLNGITNNNTAGNYQLSMKIDNNTGTGTGNQNIFPAIAASQFTINPNATITLTSGSATPNVCVNNTMTSTVYTITNATGASITSGSLPTGVAGVFSGGKFTISGTPSVTGSFPFTITTLTAGGFETLGILSGGKFNESNPPGWNGASAGNNNGDDNADWGGANGGKSYNNVTYNAATPSGAKFMIVTRDYFFCR